MSRSLADKFLDEDEDEEEFKQKEVVAVTDDRGRDKTYQS
jgi:hypothetical protein